MLTDADAKRFAAEWIEAWNSHDLDRILAHYAEDVTFFSPLVARLAGDDEGVIRGRAALRDYFARGLAAYPDLRFEPISTLTGAGSVAIHYRSVDDREAVEVVDIDPDGLVRRSAAHYSPAR